MALTEGVCAFEGEELEVRVTSPIVWEEWQTVQQRLQTMSCRPALGRHIRCAPMTKAAQRVGNLRPRLAVRPVERDRHVLATCSKARAAQTGGELTAALGASCAAEPI